MSPHVVPPRTYYVIFLILMVCTALTTAVAFIDLGPFNTLAALGIAILKATLVVLFFMHVKYSTRLTWAVVLGSLFWLGILLVMTAADYLTRGWRTYGYRQTVNSEFFILNCTRMSVPPVICPRRTADHSSSRSRS